MDQDIQKRFQLFEQEKLAPPTITHFVYDILLWLEHTSHYPCTEETAGPLASHLMLALTRVLHGEDLDAAWNPDVHEEALDLSILNPWANHIQHQTQQTLHITLPDEEIDFVLLHLGSFLLQYHDPRVSHLNASC
jgi:hypothetical protein